MGERVHQEDETKLHGTVTPAAGETFPVSPTGDMARLAPYDRNLSTITEYYVGDVAASGWTVRWTYTVPADRIYCNSIFSLIVSKAIATAGRYAVNSIERGAGSQRLASTDQRSTTNYTEQLVVTPMFYLLEDDYLKGKTAADDTITHGHYLTLMGLEFDV